MKVSNNKVWALISKDISESISDGEKQELALLLNDDPQIKKTYETLKVIEPVADHVKQDIHKEEIRQMTYQKIFSNNSRKSVQIRTIPYWISIAALFVLALTLGYQTIRLSRISDIEVNTPKGVYSKVELPDGTIVFLNSGSKMIYPARFNGRSREVKLWGEGFFDVKKDAAPFIVSSQRIRVKVLGTAFNFRNYPSDSIGIITLERGSVELSLVNHNKKVLMKPNEQVILNKNNAEFLLKSRIDPKDFSSWKDGEFVFKAISFPELCNNLERRYNYTFVIRNGNYNHETFTGKFKHGESIEQIMEIIKLNTSIQYKIDKDTILIY